MTTKFYFHNIDNLIGKAASLYPKLDQYIRSMEPLNCLDIGCGFPKHLINCYQSYNCNSIIGIDNWSEKELVERHIKQKNFKFGDMCRSFFDLYIMQYIPQISANQKIINRTSFDKIITSNIRRNYNSRFLKNHKGSYNLVIASNIFHLTHKPRLTEIFELLSEQIENHGIFFTRVEPRKQFDYQFYKDVMLKHFLDTEFLEFYNQDHKWSHTITLSKKGLIN